MNALSSVDTDTRFEFGANWSQFVERVTPRRIAQAEASLVYMLGATSLRGRRFLDIGCGSGLFSLAAHRLGAEVCSFDFDPLSVRSAETLRRLHAPTAAEWRIQHGSILDTRFIQALGRFDIVYAWGVLHHTGEMWTALERATAAVAPGGRLFVALYNDQGVRSRVWWHVKRTYNRLPPPLRIVYLAFFAAMLELGAATIALGTLDPKRLARRWTSYDSVRGMSRWHDVADWIGGFPFEVATPEAVFDFCRLRGFALEKLKTCSGRMGCNEFVLVNSGHNE